MWTKSLSNEFGRLVQGVVNKISKEGYVEETNTIFFIPRYQVPTDAKITYANIICALQLLKNKIHEIRMTVGGNKLKYDGNPSSLTVFLLNAKIFLNSVILNAKKGARFSTSDIKNH